MLKTTIYWKLFGLVSRLRKYQLELILPGAGRLIADYQRKSKTTGTKWPTLYLIIKQIQKTKPKTILELGTGTSTIVIAECLKRLKQKDPSYNPSLISMESEIVWYRLALSLLPQEHQTIVKIIYGPRKLYQYGCWRGYYHDNIPLDMEFDMIFIDGPSYDDQSGSSACLDGVRYACLNLNADAICIIDTRVSSAFVMQQIFGSKEFRYRNLTRASMGRISALDPAPLLTSQSFKYNLNGQIKLKKLS